MSVTLISPVDVLARFGDSELIPLPDLGEPIGLDRSKRDYAVTKGIIKTAQPKNTSRAGRPNGCHMVTREEALLILAAAALAAAIGVAIVTVIKSLRKSGCTVTPDGLLVPLKGLSVR